ncbi:hypothetical protein [Paenibacillus sp. Z3-2]
MAISPKVIQLIDHKLAQLIRNGCRVVRIKMQVLNWWNKDRSRRVTAFCE